MSAMISPFQVGDRVSSADLATWSYVGLSGRPDVDRNAVRRYTKGQWVLEVRALSDRNRPSRVMSVRTSGEDADWWQDQRDQR